MIMSERDSVHKEIEKLQDEVRKDVGTTYWYQHPTPQGCGSGPFSAGSCSGSISCESEF